MKKTILALFFFSALRAFAAISASTVWQLQTDGDDLNGGGYTTGGTDYSVQAAAQLTVTDGSSSSTTTLNSATGGFTSAMVGNVLQISGGTLTAGFYEIITYTDTNNVVLDRALNTGSGSTVKVGGALLTPDTAGNAMVAGNICYLKYGTYSRTTSWALTVTGTSTASIIFVSYDTNRTPGNIDANRSLITTATTATPLISGTNSDYVSWRNIMWSNTAAGANKDVCFTNVTTSSEENSAFNCSFDGFTRVTNFSSAAGSNYKLQYLHSCEIKNGTVGGIGYNAIVTIEMQNCYVHDNTGAGLEFGAAGGSITATRCIFDTNSTYGILSSRTSTSAPKLKLVGCAFYNNTSGGIHYATITALIPADAIVFNNVFYGGLYGFSVATASQLAPPAIFTHNAFGNQGTAPTLGLGSYSTNAITLTADPFTGAASGNFALNNTSGGGILLRGLGYPSLVAAGLTANYQDVGAVQHQDAGSSAVQTSWGYAK